MQKFNSHGIISPDGEFSLFALEGKRSKNQIPLVFDYGPFMLDDIEDARRNYEKARQNSDMLKW